MNITSPTFEDNGPIPRRYTCDGAGLSPHLIIEDVPEGMGSLALIVDDPDAPGGLFVHWLVWNILPKLSEITEGLPPEEAVEGLNSAGNIGYVPPCPPSGTHHYRFKLFALDIEDLSLSPESDQTELEVEMEGHILAEAQLTGLYRRS